MSETENETQQEPDVTEEVTDADTPETGTDETEE